MNSVLLLFLSLTLVVILVLWSWIAAEAVKRWLVRRYGKQVER